MSSFRNRFPVPALLCGCLRLFAVNFVWVEGEDATAHSEHLSSRHHFVSRHPALSGGVSLGGQGIAGETWAEFTLNVPEAGDYGFYVRKFWHHGPFRWRFGDGEWRSLDRPALIDNTSLDRIHMNINWVHAGRVQLPAGEITLRLEQTRDGPFVIDCLILTREPFFPRGALKPGERSGIEVEGFFTWEPEADTFDGTSVLDLRHLNEAEAGIHGPVRRQGDLFVLGDGSPVRFWMVQADLRNMEPHQIDRWARRLAAYGVNMVRMNLGSFFSRRVDQDAEAFDRELAQLHRVVASLKAQGIYSYFGHLYWQTHNRINASVVPGFDDEMAHGLLIFSREFQDWYLDYLRALLLPVNPHTGLSLAADPAVAFVEIWNESNLFFWTFRPDRLNPVELELLEKDFAAWLTHRHSSLAQARRAWGPDRRANVRTPDRPDQHRMGLYGIGHLTGADWARNQRVEARAADQLAWMATATHTFYRDMTRRIREELGLQGLIAGSNWKTADPRILGAIDRWTQTGTDVVLRNAYFSPDFARDGNPRFHAVDTGDTFRPQSALKAPAIPGVLMTPQVRGFPFMITENNWIRPNPYRAEWPFLVATYAAMTSIDGWNFFALNDPHWQHTMSVWDLNTPTVLGQFPATALMFRRGDVRIPDRPAVLEQRAKSEVFALQGTQLYEGVSRDVLWVKRLGELEGAAVTAATAVDPLAYFVGPVHQELVEGPSRLQSVDLTNHIDRRTGTVRSLTGELDWNFSRGVVRVNTPRAQGASGFLGQAGTLRFADLHLESENEYGTVLAVSLDGLPLRESRRILLQAATRDHPHGFATESLADGYQRITQLGGYPLLVETIRAKVTLHRETPPRLTRLDERGHPTSIPVQRSRDERGHWVIQLPGDSLYTLIEF